MGVGSLPTTLFVLPGQSFRQRQPGQSGQTLSASVWVGRGGPHLGFRTTLVAGILPHAAQPVCLFAVKPEAQRVPCATPPQKVFPWHGPAWIEGIQWLGAAARGRAVPGALPGLYGKLR